MHRLTSSLLALTLLGGCEFIPGQPEHRVRQGEDAVAMTFPDPEATQFRESREIRTTLNGDPNNLSICGLVNTKNQMGAYVGYKRYVFNKGRTLVDPATDTSREEVTTRLTACNDARQTRLDYPSVRSDFDVQVACEAYNDYLGGYTLQQTFEHIYRNNCGEHLTTTEQARNVPPVDWDGEPSSPVVTIR